MQGKQDTCLFFIWMNLTLNFEAGLHRSLSRSHKSTYDLVKNKNQQHNRVIRMFLFHFDSMYNSIAYNVLVRTRLSESQAEAKEQTNCEAQN